MYRMLPPSDASVQALVPDYNEVMKGFTSQFSQFIECLCHGRPLFTRWTFDFLRTQLSLGSAQTQEFNPIHVLDQLFQYIVQSVLKSKPGIRGPEGRKAQIKIIVEPALPDKNQNLISHHFASLKIDEKGGEEIPIATVERVWGTLLQIGNVELSDLHCSFPEIKDDPLLFLSLPGCLQSPSIFPLDQETVCPTARQVASKPFYQGDLDISDQTSKSSSGDFVEYLTQLSLFASSRFFGISGAPIDLFFGLFASHMLPRMPKTHETKFPKESLFECVPPMKLSTSLGQYCKSLDNAMVGFCAPCNCKWPEFISSSPWIRTGYLCSNKRNAEMIYSNRLESPNLIITTEEEKIADPLDLPAILERVPSDSNLHIVVCQHIHQDICSRGAFSKLVKGSANAAVIQSSGICRVCIKAEDNSIFFGNISGLPRLKKDHGSAARLVIFFEIGDISRPKSKEKRQPPTPNEAEPEQETPAGPDRKRLKRGK